MGKAYDRVLQAVGDKGLTQDDRPALVHLPGTGALDR